MLIRKEIESDISAIDQLLREAFSSEVEPALVHLLRERQELIVSLVAVKEDKVIGHVCASPVTVDNSSIPIAGIGPLAVNESNRCKGIGGLLMEEIINQLRISGFTAAVLLGAPDYYPRFGFSKGSDFDLTNEYGADAAFMAIELHPDALANVSGLVKYTQAFADCDA